MRKNWKCREKRSGKPVSEAAAAAQQMHRLGARDAQDGAAVAAAALLGAGQVGGPEHGVVVGVVEAEAVAG
jgi:hypothetical protein